MRRNLKRISSSLVVALCALPGTTARAEEERSAKNSVYVELLGAAGIYSLNYERHWGDWSARAGVSYLNVSTAADVMSGEQMGNAHILAIPISGTYLGWGNESHIFEAGAGLVVENHGARATNQFADSRASASESATTLWFFAPLGYRFQPRELGFLFRAGLTPVISSAGFFPWPHIGLGASF